MDFDRQTFDTLITDLQRHNDPPYWTTAEGEHLYPQQIETGHLMNILTLLERQDVHEVPKQF